MGLATGDLRRQRNKLTPEYVASRKAESEQYLGVYWNKRLDVFTSTLTVKGTAHQCGTYDTGREAAKARDLRILYLGLDLKLQVLTRKEK
jgi:hypothetical protein